MCAKLHVNLCGLGATMLVKVGFSAHVYVFKSTCEYACVGASIFVNVCVRECMLLNVCESTCESVWPGANLLMNVGGREELWLSECECAC